MAKHIMKSVRRMDNGDQDWYCSECGRRIDIIDGNVIVIASGDKTATHTYPNYGHQPPASTSGKFGASDLSIWEKALEDTDVSLT